MKIIIFTKDASCLKQCLKSRTATCKKKHDSQLQKCRLMMPREREKKKITLWTDEIWCTKQADHENEQISSRTTYLLASTIPSGRSQWPRGLRRRSTAARLLRLWVWIPPGEWMFVCCEYCVLSGRGLCDGLITCPGESYRLWRVVVCHQETSKTRRLKPARGLWKYNHNGL